MAVLLADSDTIRGKSLSTPGSDVALITICGPEREAEVTIRDEIVNDSVILAK